MQDTISVTTQDDVADILSAGNSAAWSLNVKQWSSRLTNLVCLRKTGTRDRAAFLICRDLSFSVDEEATRVADRLKYAIEFRRYALIELPVALSSSQNPVRITTLSDLFGADHLNELPSEDSFQHVGPKELPFSYSRRAPRAPRPGIDISQAKRLLSQHYDVPEPAIQIIITF
jgi:hypothetical protein